MSMHKSAESKRSAKLWKNEKVGFAKRVSRFLFAGQKYLSVFGQLPRRGFVCENGQLSGIFAGLGAEMAFSSLDRCHQNFSDLKIIKGGLKNQ